jgi:hypothetical protein
MLDIISDFEAVIFAANETFNVEGGMLGAGMEGFLCDITDSKKKERVRYVL